MRCLVWSGLAFSGSYSCKNLWGWCLVAYSRWRSWRGDSEYIWYRLQHRRRQKHRMRTSRKMGDGHRGGEFKTRYSRGFSKRLIEALMARRAMELIESRNLGSPEPAMYGSPRAFPLPWMASTTMTSNPLVEPTAPPAHRGRSSSRFEKPLVLTWSLHEWTPAFMWSRIRGVKFLVAWLGVGDMQYPAPLVFMESISSLVDDSFLAPLWPGSPWSLSPKQTFSSFVCRGSM